MFWALHVQEQDFQARQVAVNVKMNVKKSMSWEDVVHGLIGKDKALFKRMAPILRQIRGNHGFLASGAAEPLCHAAGAGRPLVGPYGDCE